MTKLTLVFTVLMTFAFSHSALSAGYLKIDGVDGESKKTQAAPKPTTQIKKAEDGETAGLLLPAVQAAREAAHSDDSKKKKGKVEATWKVEEGEK